MTSENHQMLFVKDEVVKLQKANPKLRFTQAWELVRKKHPELFASQIAKQTALAQQGSSVAYMRAIGILQAERAEPDVWEQLDEGTLYNPRTGETYRYAE